MTTTRPATGRVSTDSIPSIPESAFSTLPAQEGQSISGTENSAVSDVEVPADAP